MSKQHSHNSKLSTILYLHDHCHLSFPFHIHAHLLSPSRSIQNDVRSWKQTHNTRYRCTRPVRTVGSCRRDLLFYVFKGQKIIEVPLVQQVNSQLFSLSTSSRTRATSGDGLILHLFVVSDLSSQPDRGEQTCCATSSNVERSLCGLSPNTSIGSFLSLFTSIRNNGHSWLRTHLAFLHCTGPVVAKGSWRTLQHLRTLEDYRMATNPNTPLPYTIVSTQLN